MAFYFDRAVHNCNCWLKIVNHWDKRDNSQVFCLQRRKIKSGLKLLLMKTAVATHTCKLL